MSPTSYIYDEQSKLTVVTCANTGRTNSDHNGEGKRLSEVKGAVTIKYRYDQHKVALERDGSDNTVASYTDEAGVLYQSLLSMSRRGASYHAAPA